MELPQKRKVEAVDDKDKRDNKPPGQPQSGARLQVRGLENKMVFGGIASIDGMGRVHHMDHLDHLAHPADRANPVLQPCKFKRTEVLLIGRRGFFTGLSAKASG
jgi:hypothetical protein